MWGFRVSAWAGGSELVESYADVFTRTLVWESIQRWSEVAQ